MRHLLRTYNFLAFALLNVFVLITNGLFAQKNAAARYEIDAKRIGVSPNEKDALPRSREFLRLDSTYYVGWMYEGMYKYDRSADYLGYKYAMTPLKKAFDLLDKDFGDKFRNIFSSGMYYEQYRYRMNDLLEIAYALKMCYNSVEMPDSAMALIDKMESYHFQKDFFDVYNERAWIYHRNRFFTSEQFKFLRNTVEENEEMAFRCCYMQLSEIQRKKDINDYWFGPYQSHDDILSVEHNLALLHCYNQNYDSAEYYYQHLIEGNRVLWGNYAGMQHELGNIDSSIMYYAMPQASGEHALSEPDYFMPSLFVYGGRAKEGIEMEQNKIAESGSTPGFGWYNIALGRSYLYDGQLDSAEFFLNKAANFKELHLHTTLTQSQYEFTINLLKVQLLDKKAEQIKFLNKGWWYSLSDLYDFFSLKVEKIMTEYVVVNELANNPERKRIVYDLFCGESTVTFDEIMFLLKDFSNPYFENKYSESLAVDKRKKIHRYFKLFSSRLNLESDNTEDAQALAERMLKESFIETADDPSTVVDTANEKLFLARIYEILAITNEDNDDEAATSKYNHLLFEEYPQLVPFSGTRMKMNLVTAGETDPLITEVIEELRDCNIDWTEENDPNTPVAMITFAKKGKAYQAMIDVRSGSGKPIVSSGEMVFKKSEGVGKELALRLFAKGGGIAFEKEEKPN